ncbi:adenosylcobinamide-phosphate synthase CbiB [Rhodoblastus acidophilus]|uniref:Cobalamin biosynthesis protein CobD n=1 Tax=Candidatus Rhodoblastus alkanivorans TaxID=2954117 RepID=A0ABS9Z455_9HYPH|nr:adenosylcobinamide-phosphate synthase CbiB [Candidatus Rhodoblastus alkanivorans]MCI4677410.1 adenosylcobinamide-phosphate synthase CbiB [Candidatus Rhodoblastus alkanivorans]MCI4682145.1 adenosylcobinamide-phosphate synthase CbiB [Candidatus Rhodoblastus alkanivorans]MDI4639447.1 adenosylcobinamide-phosphate synthase CbiB [Rhodoblastus acidophilus]
MFSAYSLELAFAALLVEALFGYPAPVYEAIRHPVNWIGALIARLEQMLNRADLPDDARKAAGVLALLVTLAASVLAAGIVTDWTPKNGFGFLLLAVVASSLVAQRSLHDHVAAVAEALEREGLEGGRAKVAKIVGRDVAALDAAGVARAAVESLAENFSDGVVAPALWIAAFGLKGGALYKAVNTADSMIGHKNARYLEFGWAAARFDDLINLPASRLAVLWLILAAAFTRGAEWRDAWTAVRRDAPKHRSPNAGWPEAAMAGALGFKLAGPRVYGGMAVDDVYMGDGRAALDAADIRRALTLYRRACAAQMLALLLPLAALAR